MTGLMKYLDGEDFAPHFLEVAPTGSRFICDPPPMDTDRDFIALTINADRSDKAMRELGYRVEGRPGFYTGNDNGKFVSYRKGDTNVIATPEQEFFDLFRSATELARRFNLTKKADRIALFQAVLYGVGPHNLEVSA